MWTPRSPIASATTSSLFPTKPTARSPGGWRATCALPCRTRLSSGSPERRCSSEITKRIFGNYVSRYDFKRSEEDGATVKLVYENRGEKLGVARADLNDEIAAKIEEAELDPDQAALID